MDILSSKMKVLRRIRSAIFTWIARLFTVYIKWRFNRWGTPMEEAFSRIIEGWKKIPKEDPEGYQRNEGLYWRVLWHIENEYEFHCHGRGDGWELFQEALVLVRIAKTL